MKDPTPTRRRARARRVSPPAPPVERIAPEAARFANDLIGDLVERFAAFKAADPDSDASAWSIDERCYVVVGDAHISLPAEVRKLPAPVLAALLSWARHTFGIDGYVAVHEGLAVLPNTPAEWKALAAYRQNGGTIEAHPDAGRVLLSIGFSGEGVFQHASRWPSGDVPQRAVHRSVSPPMHPFCGAVACQHVRTVGDES